MGKVLVADDDRNVRELLRQIVEDMGHEAIAVANGRQACEILGRTKVDLVLMDIIMPVQDGASATMSIRRDCALNRRVPIIGISTAECFMNGYSYKDIGFDLFLRKPFDQDVIEQALRTIGLYALIGG